MSVDFLKARSIKYLNKDFNSFKRDMIKFSQAHHSGVFQDFNESSPGMAILELQAYVGDVLSFYQDMQFEELKHENAQQIENVVSISKQLGYRPSGKRAAHGTQTFYIEVPASSQGGTPTPDDLYTPILRKGSKVAGPNGVIFETLQDVFFSASAPTDDTSSTRMVTGSKFDDATGLPTFFAVRKDCPVIAGETQEDSVSVGDFQQFKTIELAKQDVIEVLSVFDSDGNEWTEVDFLAQDLVFDLTVNTDDDSDTVPYVLRYVSVPRRFIVDRDPTTNKTSLIFGSGDGVNFDDELLPNLADLALPLPGRRTFTTFPLDPQNFLKTRSLGLCPFNTTLTIQYRTGGGDQTNVSRATIKSVSEAVIDFTTTGLDAAKRANVIGSLETTNLDKTEGGGPEETISEIKANSAAFFAAQNRVVTKEDFIARVLSLPAKFGSVAKVYVRRDNVNPLGLDIHVLAKDSEGHLTQATNNLTNNIATYLRPFRMLTDGINILQTNIINMRVEFGIVVSPRANRTEVLAKCLNAIRSYFAFQDSSANWTCSLQIGEPIVVSDLVSTLQNIVGVISVYRLDFKNLFGSQQDGTNYSIVRFNPQAHTSNGILYCPENSIFEVKFVTKDIAGESK